MTVDEVIAAASKETGLSDIGDPSALEGLRRLLESYTNEARFTEQGSEMAHGFLVAQMAHRMRIEDWLARHPELLERDIEKPLIVFGLPRTGTTLMVNLLAADPASRCYMRWESLAPMPPTTPEEVHGGPRFDEAAAQGEMAKVHMPHIAAIHWEDADSPTECQFLMTPSFCAQVYEAQADIPSYRNWFLHEADYRPAFRFHKRMLQALQHHVGGRWTLKNPWHPLFLDTLAETYPDARLVMTHRDPAEVVGSCCSLIKYVRQMGVVRGIYDNFDEPLNDEANAAISSFMADNPKGKHGKHSYALEEYGLSAEGVREEFSDYIERYGIPVRS